MARISGTRRPHGSAGIRQVASAAQGCRDLSGGARPGQIARCNSRIASKTAPTSGVGARQRVRNVSTKGTKIRRYALARPQPQQRRDERRPARQQDQKQQPLASEYQQQSLALGREGIRDVIAFPKTSMAVDLMSQAPSKVTPEQMAELQILSTAKKDDAQAE